MKSTIFRSVAIATTFGATLLVGCDSVKDVREEPYLAIPTPTAVLKGTIRGVGEMRPVALTYDGQPNCFSPDPTNPAVQVPSSCRFYGVAGQAASGFTFGSLDVGTPYSIAVQTQPYGKLCTVENATGTVGGGGPEPVVNCADNVAVVPRHDLTVTIDAAAQALPNLKVRVLTEEDDMEMDATGLASVTFPEVLFDSGTNLPLFEFRVFATTQTTVGGETITNLCTFDQDATFSAGGRNINAMWTWTGNPQQSDSVVVPTGPVTVNVRQCDFTVTTTVQYHGTPAMTMPAGGMTLALRNHLTGVDEQTLDVAAFTSAAGFNPETVAFPTPVKANSRAIYELVVTRQPEGMHCVVAGSTHVVSDIRSTTAGQNGAVIAPTASAVLLVDPSVSDWWAYENRQVRCRAVPAPENRLVGTYQMDRREPSDTYPNPGRGREFLSFFEDGSFIYAINFNAASLTSGFPNATFPAAFAVRNNAYASSGVSHGFYAYDSAAGTITFTVFTTTSTNPAGRGITGMPGYMNANTWSTNPQVATGSGLIQALVTGTVTASNVVKSINAAGLGTFSMQFSGTAAGQPVNRLWTMTEPDLIEGELTGAWVTADHRRMFSYHGAETFAFHAGVNGLGNLQDVCMLPTDTSTQSSGVITKRAGSSRNDNFQYTCTPGAANWPVSVFATYNTRTPDLPHYLPRNATPSSLSGPTVPRTVPGFNGRFPGAGGQLDNRPNSPTHFDIVPGSPDTLTVQETLNGNPVGEPLVFTRHRAN